MQDYRFGNYLYKLRKNAGLSQNELAWQLGVTNKAVSKWETGKAKPGTETLEKLERLPNCRRVEIIQTYLTAPEGEESRVRQRGADGNYIYMQTRKKKVSDLKRVEIERRLTKDEYLCLLMDADPDCRPIRKTRLCSTEKSCRKVPKKWRFFRTIVLLSTDIKRVLPSQDSFYKRHRFKPFQHRKKPGNQL